MRIMRPFMAQVLGMFLSPVAQASVQQIMLSQQAYDSAIMRARPRAALASHVKSKRCVAHDRRASAKRRAKRRAKRLGQA